MTSLSLTNQNVWGCFVFHCPNNVHNLRGGKTVKMMNIVLKSLMKNGTTSPRCVHSKSQDSSAEVLVKHVRC